LEMAHHSNGGYGNISLSRCIRCLLNTKLNDAECIDNPYN
jgi:hypothetical protein